MSRMYEITKENYKWILERMQRKAGKWRMLTEKKDYSDIGNLTRSGIYPDRKLRICVKSYGKKNRKDISYFVYVTDCSLEKELTYNDEELILIDLGAGNIISLRSGDRIRFETYGFIVYQKIYVNEVPGASVTRFVMHKGCPAARITDYEILKNRRMEEWKRLYSDSMAENLTAG